MPLLYHLRTQKRETRWSTRKVLKSPSFFHDFLTSNFAALTITKVFVLYHHINPLLVERGSPRLNKVWMTAGVNSGQKTLQESLHKCCCGWREKKSFQNKIPTIAQPSIKFYLHWRSNHFKKGFLHSHRKSFTAKKVVVVVVMYWKNIYVYYVSKHVYFLCGIWVPIGLRYMHREFYRLSGRRQRLCGAFSSSWDVKYISWWTCTFHNLLINIKTQLIYWGTLMLITILAEHPCSQNSLLLSLQSTVSLTHEWISWRIYFHFHHF